MQTPQRVGGLFQLGVILLFIALLLQNVTLAGGDYRPVLIVALLLTLLADACFVAVFIRGRLAARSAAIVLLLPTIFVVADFLRRAPGTFAR